MRIRTISEFIIPHEHIAINRDDLYVPSEIHQHEFVELEYVLTGQGIQYINGEEFPIKRGDVIILETGNFHSYHSQNDLQILNCIVEPAFYQRQIEQLSQSDEDAAFTLPKYVSLTGKYFIETENLLFSMEQEFKSKPAFYRQMLDKYLFSLLVILYRNVYENQISKTDQLQKQLYEYVEKNYVYCSLQSAAQHFGYSSSYFCRLFKKVMGENFSDYVNQKKMSEAINLLSKTAFSIDTICHQLGFKDRKQFYRLFQKRTGTSPSQYRKGQKQRG